MHFSSLILALGTNVTPRGGGTPTPSLPYQADLLAWYDATDSATLFSDAGTTPAGAGTGAYRLADKSANGHHLDQSTAASQPTVRSIDGVTCIQFDNTDFYTLPAGLTVDKQASTIIAVYSSVAVTTQNLLWMPGGAAELVFFTNAGTGATNLRTTQAATGGGSAAVRQSGIDSSFGIQAAVQVNRTTENRMHLGKEISAAFAAAPAGTAAGGWLGQSSTGTNRLRGNLYALLVYNRALTDPEIAEVVDYYSDTLGALRRTADLWVGFEGDSIPEGVGTSNFVSGFYAAMSYPNQFGRLADGRMKFMNAATGGDKLENMVSDFDLASSKLRIQLLANAAFTTRVIDIHASTNDINTAFRVDGTTPQSSAAIIADFQSLVSKIKTADATCIVIGNTVLPRTDFAGSEVTIWNEVNTAIRNGTIAFDHVIDLAADAVLDDPADTTIYVPGDGVHLTDAGSARVAALKLAAYQGFGLL